MCCAEKIRWISFGIMKRAFTKNVGRILLKKKMKMKKKKKKKKKKGKGKRKKEK